jgi:hypothetical protein
LRLGNIYMRVVKPSNSNNLNNPINSSKPNLCKSVQTCANPCKLCKPVQTRANLFKLCKLCKSVQILVCSSNEPGDLSNCSPLRKPGVEALVWAVEASTLGNPQRTLCQEVRRPITVCMHNSIGLTVSVTTARRADSTAPMN